jgi:transcriptional regulator
MYTPPDFQYADQQDMIDFIKQHSFGLLITAANELKATHIPFSYDAKTKLITGHISRANTQLHDWIDGQDVLMVFQGPHAYVSSGWYNHPNVPTWNYVAVHVYGQLHLLKEATKIKEALIDLVNHYEKGEKQPLDVSKIDHVINKEMRGITFFEVKNLRFEGAKKLSQNRQANDHQSIINHLESKSDFQANKIAEMMKKPKN